MIPTEYLIPPHKVKSRPAKNDADIERIRKDAETMKMVLKGPLGIWNIGYSIAHSQITNKDPLCFFVTREGEIIVNPVITRHTKAEIPQTEGCLTFHWSDCKALQVPRFHKAQITCYKLTSTGYEEYEGEVTGLIAQIFQHEIDHFNGIYYYDRAGIERPKRK